MNKFTMKFCQAVTFAVLMGCALVVRAGQTSWTDEETENYWGDIAEKTTRTSTSPRFEEADEVQGEGILEAFGAQYLPNAYAHYQEVRATAKEREQLLKENFPDGRSSDPAGGAIYDKVCKAATKSVSEMFRRHDELCHYLLLHRMGAVSDRELADLDATRISILLPLQYSPPGPCNLTAPVLAPAEIDFASKYLPETHAAFLRLGNVFSEGAKAFEEWRQTALLVDAARSWSLFYALGQRLNAIQGTMNGIVKMVKEQKLLHAVGETTATSLAEKDKEVGLAVQQFEKGLAVGPWVLSHVRSTIERCKQVAWPTFIPKTMVKIPGRGFWMGKYEVTQAQWEIVMGKNPSEFKGLYNPVENVSWYDCQEFLKRLNELPSVKKSGFTFRLPTEEEWEYACRAWAKDDYCKLADGTEITRKTLGEVAWFEDNADKQTHPVGQKEPNAFGLYDMHGNVREWISTANGRLRACRGGSWDNSAMGCESSCRDDSSFPDRRNRDLGFRLCASGRADSGRQVNDAPMFDEVAEEQATARGGEGGRAAVRPIERLVSDMVQIPGKNYKMGKTEVTQAQWEAVMGENPSKFKGADDPVEWVSWDDCQKFLEKLNALPAVKESGLAFRLPTEEEWEYACRAGAKGDYYRLADGTEITDSTLGQVAWFMERSDEQTHHPVGQKQPNAFGLYDMHGNVFELTSSGTGSSLAGCGGAWYSAPFQCKSSYRAEAQHDSRGISLGFRLCADGEGKTGSAVVDSTVPGVSMMGKPRMGVAMLTFHGAEMSDGVWPNGVIVTDVEDDSPAARAGLRAGDVILKANENRIVALEDLTAVLIRLKEGNPVNLKIWRPDDVENAGTEQMGISMSGKNMDVRVILAVLE